MKPYYQDASVTIYHGDCAIAEQWLSGDLLVTDPPYGISWSKGLSATRSSRAHDGIQNDHNTSARDLALSWWGDRPGVVFGSLYAPFPMNLRHVLVWEKPGDAGVFGSTTGYRRDVEAVFLTGTWPRVDAKWGSVVRSTMRKVGGAASPAGRTGHPHTKPVDLLCTLMQRAPSGVVADPFMGSGSTLVAAKAMGRTAIGIEIEERYCEIAARRCSQETLDLGAA
jgi:DNA modification methylase